MGKFKSSFKQISNEELNNNRQNGDVQNNNGKFFDPMSVTWTEKYDSHIAKVWDKVPRSFAKIIITVAVFALGISINGNWLSLGVHLAKQLGYFNHTDNNQIPFHWSNITLESLKLNNIGHFWISSSLISYGIYFLVGGFLHWYYYVRRRDSAEKWKIQPTKWLPPDLEKHEILLGSFTLLCNSTFTALLACFISNGGYSTVYYNIADYGWTWFFLQFVVVFLYQDYLTYWLHRTYHLPFLYKKFHKLHHKYKQPTAFSVTAIHPVESLHIQAVLCLPLFCVPVHWFPFYFVAIYTYYHGIIDHSGIDFKAYWWQPWQPDAVFHDNHHQYFHVNFAFNIYLWDKIHGTYRRKDRVYREDTFYGTGVSLNEASAEEIKADLEERKSENTNAHRDVKNYLLSAEELKNISVSHQVALSNEQNGFNKQDGLSSQQDGFYNQEYSKLGELITRSSTLNKTQLEVKSFAVSRSETKTAITTTTKVTKKIN